MPQDDDPDPGTRRLGEYIRLQRQMAELSLRRMSEMTQVSNAYLSQVERGLHQPSIRVLRSIAGALGLSADTLLLQAGLMDGPPVDGVDGVDGVEDVEDVDTSRVRSGSSGGATEAAIRNDPALSADDREILLRLYRSLARRTDDAG